MQLWKQRRIQYQPKCISSHTHIDTVYIYLCVYYRYLYIYIYSYIYIQKNNNQNGSILVATELSLMLQCNDYMCTILIGSLKPTLWE